MTLGSAIRGGLVVPPLISSRPHNQAISSNSPYQLQQAIKSHSVQRQEFRGDNLHQLELCWFMIDEASFYTTQLKKNYMNEYNQADALVRRQS